MMINKVEPLWYAYWPPFVYLLWRNIYSNLLSTDQCVFSLLSYMISLYILEIIIYRVCNAFSHLVNCLFTLLIISFALWKLFINSLMLSDLIIFNLVACSFGIISKKIVAKASVEKKKYSPCFLLVNLWIRVFYLTLMI